MIQQFVRAVNENKELEAENETLCQISTLSPQMPFNIVLNIYNYKFKF